MPPTEEPAAEEPPAEEATGGQGSLGYVDYVDMEAPSSTVYETVVRI
jgi:hypothetical protein